VRRVSRVSCRTVDNALMQGNTGIDRVLLYLSNKDLMQAVICPRRKKKIECRPVVGEAIARDRHQTVPHTTVDLSFFLLSWTFISWQGL
jgi:hypothetical protein